MSAMYDVSKNVTNTISTKVKSTLSINFDDKKVRYEMNCFILHTFLLVTILLIMIAIICYHYAKYRSKQKNIGTWTIWKWRIINFKKFPSKLIRVIISVT